MVALLQKLKSSLSKSADTIEFAMSAEEDRYRGDTKKALKRCEEGIAKYPSYATGHFILAKCYLDQSMNTEAKESLAEALRFEPHHLSVLCELASVYQSEGNTSQALHYYRQALAIDPLNSRIESLVLEITGKVGSPEDTATEIDAPPSQVQSETVEDIDTADINSFAETTPQIPPPIVESPDEPETSEVDADLTEPQFATDDQVSTLATESVVVDGLETKAQGPWIGQMFGEQLPSPPIQEGSNTDEEQPWPSSVLSSLMELGTRTDMLTFSVAHKEYPQPTIDSQTEVAEPPADDMGDIEDHGSTIASPADIEDDFGPDSPETSAEQIETDKPDISGGVEDQVDDAADMDFPSGDITDDATEDSDSRTDVEEPVPTDELDISDGVEDQVDDAVDMDFSSVDITDDATADSDSRTDVEEAAQESQETPRKWGEEQPYTADAEDSEDTTRDTSVEDVIGDQSEGEASAAQSTSDDVNEQVGEAISMDEISPPPPADTLYHSDESASLQDADQIEPDDSDDLEEEATGTALDEDPFAEAPESIPDCPVETPPLAAVEPETSHEPVDDVGKTEVPSTSSWSLADVETGETEEVHDGGAGFSDDEPLQEAESSETSTPRATAQGDTEEAGDYLDQFFAETFSGQQDPPEPEGTIIPTDRTEDEPVDDATNVLDAPADTGSTGVQEQSEISSDPSPAESASDQENEEQDGDPEEDSHPKITKSDPLLDESWTPSLSLTGPSDIDQETEPASEDGQESFEDLPDGSGQITSTPSDSRTEAIPTATLAELYVRQGLIDRAIAVYLTLIEHDPTNPDIHKRLSELFVIKSQGGRS